MLIESKHFLRNPKTSLVVSCLAWKLLFIAIALTSPGPGYDTSTTLMSSSELPLNANILLRVLDRLTTKLVRWDAIYYTQTARRGYVYEQEWAFGWGFTRIIALLGRGLQTTGLDDSNCCFHIEALLGVAIAHLCHLLSVLMLYSLTKFVFASQGHQRSTVLGLVSACLHIVTPAGMFLSAPYAESLFSLLQFSGFYLYSKSKEMRPTSNGSFLRNLNVLISGLLFGLATSVRSNGLFSGFIYAYDATETMIPILRTRTCDSTKLRRMLVTILGGISVAAGAIYPQYLAYLEFCMGSQLKNGKEPSPWCAKYPPSIYAWVQKKYWNVGFLRYWTFSNIPLFAIAIPMLFLLIRSTVWAWTEFSYSAPVNTGPTPQQSKLKTDPTTKAFASNSPHSSERDRIYLLVRLLSLPQVVLAILALTNYHVQIITRLSSGYPVWYWWLAILACRNEKDVGFSGNWDVSQITIKWMVMYAIIQGGLFASFLPPA